MTEIETLLNHLQAADAAAQQVVERRPSLEKAVGVIRLMLTDLIEAAEALEAVR